MNRDKTAGKYLQELYCFDYDHALDYRDNLERENGVAIAAVSSSTLKERNNEDDYYSRLLSSA
jgi:hypothetical protein